MSNIYDNETMRQSTPTEDEMINQKIWGGYNPYADAVLDTAKGSMINIQDSSNRWLPSISIMGKSTQTKTNGYQLLERLTVGETLLTNGITFTVLEYGQIKIQGTATANAHFRLHNDILNPLTRGSYILELQNLPNGVKVNIAYIGDRTNGNNNLSLTTEGREYSFMLIVESGTSVDTVIQTQLVRGTTPQDYESYTGGLPSPSIDYPQAITDTTSEEIEITDGTNTQTANFNLTLRGIPVSSGGNYTDNDGQQWVCDTIERYKDGTGKLIQRVGNYTLNGSEPWYLHNTGKLYADISNSSNIFWSGEGHAICSHLTNRGTTLDGEYIYNGSAGIYLNKNTHYQTVEELKTFLQTNNMTVEICLKVYTETPLTAEQLDALNLSTYYPTTTIVSSPDIEIEYVCDTKNYINRINNN